ncbi:FAD-dependent oxidoreductase family protein isoform X1 [Carex rostrata]
MILRRAAQSSWRAAGRRWFGSGSPRVEGAPREKADAVVIGAGVVGLSVARALAMAGREVIVLEASGSFGTGTSSRNSEVIHAGIYYPANSLKARFCLRGKELLYKYCAEREIPHKRIGKLIVATSDAEIPKLEAIFARGKGNGVEDLEMIEPSRVVEMEPEVRCVKAVLSPSSGIVDSHSLMLSLLGEAESHGTTISYNTTVVGGHVENNRLHLHISETKGLESNTGNSLLQAQLMLTPNLIINSAGLSAVPLAKRFLGLGPSIVPDAYYARGCYFTIAQTKKPPFYRLIYPLPEEGGIGVHVTLDLNGSIKFGPDVEWIDGIDDLACFLNRFDYFVNPDRSAKFYGEIRKYFPNLKDGFLEPGYSGIRPKISGRGQAPLDFIVQGEDVHGVNGLVNLFGIESPGLTSSLAIAEHVISKYIR